MAALEAEAWQTRQSLADELSALGGRLEPGHMIAQGMSRARSAAQREVEAALDDVGAWVRANALLMAGLAATLGAMAALGYGVTRRRVVPPYQAFQMEDPSMHEIDGTTPRTWDRMREGAEELGQKASETYFHARSKAAELGANAREKAVEAADDATELAHRTADWTKRQSQDNPMTSVIVGFALGAILAALMPRGGRRGG
jgi:ElaB/YqjD/DUF883 family membrane-anchored ribosome-binding protein